MGKAMGPSFLTFEEVKSGDLLKKGDIIQIWRGLGYMHTVLFKDYEQCYHVVEKKNDKNYCSSFRNALKTGTIGTSVYISKHLLEYILYSGPRNSNGDPIIQKDSEGNIIAPKLDTLRVNNLEIVAKNKGIDVKKCNSEDYLDGMFKKLDEMITRKKTISYHLLIKNCESHAYEWKYGEKWTQHKVFGIANVTFPADNNRISDKHQTTIHVYSDYNMAHFDYNDWDQIKPNLTCVKQFIRDSVRNSHQTFIIVE